MLIAACRPFKAIIGLEFARRLHEIATENCRTYRHPDQKCHSLLPIMGDVLNSFAALGADYLFYVQSLRSTDAARGIRELAHALSAGRT